MLVIGSVRPGRFGLPVTLWAYDALTAAGGFDIDFVDLMETDLPFMDEPRPPRLKQYEHAHTRAWSARVDAADAFIFVAPAYNDGYAPALRNAMDYLALEWQDKPLGIATYGSGARDGASRIRRTASSLGLVPVTTAIGIPDVRARVQDGEFAGDDDYALTCSRMIEEIKRLHAELSPRRAAQPQEVRETVGG